MTEDSPAVVWADAANENARHSGKESPVYLSDVEKSEGSSLFGGSGRSEVQFYLIHSRQILRGERVTADVRKSLRRAISQVLSGPRKAVVFDLDAMRFKDGAPFLFARGIVDITSEVSLYYQPPHGSVEVSTRSEP